MKWVKCVVWDLDNTIWDGTLIEDRRVVLRNEVAGVIETLDERGILQSVASKNHEPDALAQIHAFGLGDYFLHPQIHWHSKADSVKKIAELINIGVDTLAFVDDRPEERAEVAFSLPQVMCIDAAQALAIPMLPEFNPRFISADSAHRRQMYQAEQRRRREEGVFSGPREDFLASLGMRLTIFQATEADLQRAEELTVRTNQLNSTGRTYSYAELNDYRLSDSHLLLMARLEDRYGGYGNVGLALIECGREAWTLKLFLMSCRVMDKGIGTALLSCIMSLAKGVGVKLKAEFVENDRNRIMNITYRLTGFRGETKRGAIEILHHDLAKIPLAPPYIHLVEKYLVTNG